MLAASPVRVLVVLVRGRVQGPDPGGARRHAMQEHVCIRIHIYIYTVHLAFWDISYFEVLIKNVADSGTIPDPFRYAKDIVEMHMACIEYHLFGRTRKYVYTQNYVYI